MQSHTYKMTLGYFLKCNIANNIICAQLGFFASL